ncbi:PilZ domain-containing protein [Aurantiacibacter aquimixticola]|uniref:PilZ domain-containing protein n=1 Tax=Aurantiacibacter aquimixticola TaxID=1958945 RepID=A0A419RUR9_9SPHN|nr:PilZ domain-containing protein [Aurantiacibacter aquimixticola]RJY09494.1 PilZ domain-containing protein [Aurantiacibacter aquimixticola]
MATAEQKLVDHTDQRDATRYTLLIRAAKLVSRDGEFLCVIRDASESGVSVRIFHPIPDQGRMILELQNGDRYSVDPVWQEEVRAGFRFAVKADIARIIASPSAFSKRPVRINLTAPAEIEAAGRIEHATFQDISQQGAKVACRSGFAIDQRVKLVAEGMEDIFAKVRWRRDGTSGLVFDNTLQFGELARIALALQNRG